MANGVPPNSPYYYGGGGRKPAPPPPHFPPPDQEFGTIPLPPPYAGYMSPQDLAALATKTIADAYAPQLNYLQQQAARAQQMRAAQQSGLVELYKILAGSLSGLGDQISGIYTQGAGDIGKYAQGVVSNDLPTEQAIVSSGAAQGPGYGQAYPQLAGQQGQVEFLKAVQDANQQEGDLASQIQQLIAQEPEKVQTLLQQLQSQQTDYAKAAQPIIRSSGGSLIAYDPVTGKTKVLYQGASSSRVQTYRDGAGNTYAIGPDGSITKLPGSAKTVTHHYTATSGGDVLDTTTGKVVGRVTVKPTSPGKPTYWTDKAGNRHMTTGQGEDSIIAPAGSQGMKPPTAATLAKARKVLAATKNGFASTTDPNTPLSVSQLRGIVNDYNAQARRQGHTEITVATLAQATPEQLAVLGLSKFGPQQAYLGMVALGVPARRAWQMVRSRYPSWGAGYFSGKGDAAATGGNQGVSYKASDIKTPDMARQAGLAMAASDYGWTNEEAQALDKLWTSESGWDWRIKNRAGSGATGIPQALPASKMASAGSDWRTNPLTQIKWGLGYIKAVYGSPSRAWAFWQATVNKNPNLVPPDLRGKAQQWIKLGYTGY